MLHYSNKKYQLSSEKYYPKSQIKENTRFKINFSKETPKTPKSNHKLRNMHLSCKKMNFPNTQSFYSQTVDFQQKKSVTERITCAHSQYKIDAFCCLGSFTKKRFPKRRKNILKSWERASEKHPYEYYFFENQNTNRNSQKLTSSKNSFLNYRKTRKSQKKMGKMFDHKKIYMMSKDTYNQTSVGRGETKLSILPNHLSEKRKITNGKCTRSKKSEMLFTEKDISKKEKNSKKSAKYKNSNIPCFNISKTSNSLQSNKKSFDSLCLSPKTQKTWNHVEKLSILPKKQIDRKSIIKDSMQIIPKIYQKQDSPCQSQSLNIQRNSLSIQKNGAINYTNQGKQNKKTKKQFRGWGVKAVHHFLYGNKSHVDHTFAFSYKCPQKKQQSPDYSSNLFSNKFNKNILNSRKNRRASSNSMKFTKNFTGSNFRLTESAETDALSKQTR